MVGTHDSEANLFELGNQTKFRIKSSKFMPHTSSTASADNKYRREIARDTARKSRSDIDAVCELGQLLVYGNQIQREFISEVLLYLDDTAEIILPVIVMALRDESAVVRKNSATFVGILGPKAKLILPGLYKLLLDDDESVRVAAIWAIRRIAH